MTTQTIRQIIARSGLDAYNEEISAACDAIDAQLSALEQQGEPFGYFRAEPFGWTDCEATDEGAIALYEHPAADLTDEQIRAIGKKFFPKTILSAAWFGFARAIIAKVKGVE